MKDLWLRNTYFVTESSFPTILRRLQVIKKVDIEVSPIDNAIHSVQGFDSFAKASNTLQREEQRACGDYLQA